MFSKINKDITKHFISLGIFLSGGYYITNENNKKIIKIK
jgi:hypothetical protein